MSHTSSHGWPRAYWINLARNPQRRTYMEAWLAGLGFGDAVRIDAVDALEDVGTVIRAPAHTRAYENACTASHLLAIHTAWQNGDEVALILEDDVEFFPFVGARPDFAELVPDPPSGWGAIQLCVQQDPIRLDWLFRRKDPYVPVARRCWWSLAAYLISRPAMQYLLKRYRTDFGFDVTSFDGTFEAYMVIMHSLPPDLPAFVTRVAPLTTLENDSDLHPDHLDRHRRACAFSGAHLPAVRSGHYSSLFPLWRRALEELRF